MESCVQHTGSGTREQTSRRKETVPLRNFSIYADVQVIFCCVFFWRDNLCTSSLCGVFYLFINLEVLELRFLDSFLKVLLIKRIIYTIQLPMDCAKSKDCAIIHYRQTATSISNDLYFGSLGSVAKSGLGQPLSYIYVKSIINNQNCSLRLNRVRLISMMTLGLDCIHFA